MMERTYRVQETVIHYHPEELAQWQGGDKSRWLQGPIPDHVTNQPAYHFGEYYVLSYFRRALWQGHRFYALGDWEPENRKYDEGRAAIARRIPTERLRQFKRIRSTGSNSGKGEPDLFLYMENGPNLFLEIKKGADRISPEQLTCLAQIKAILDAEVSVVYLAKYGQRYKPKVYELDLETYQGRQVSLAIERRADGITFTSSSPSTNRICSISPALRRSRS